MLKNSQQLEWGEKWVRLQDSGAEKDFKTGGPRDSEHLCKLRAGQLHLRDLIPVHRHKHCLADSCLEGHS